MDSLLEAALAGDVVYADHTPAQHAKRRLQHDVMAAIWAGDAANVQARLQAGGMINWKETQPDQEGDPCQPLQHAAAYGHEGVTKLLLRAGAEVDVTMPEEESSDSDDSSSSVPAWRHSYFTPLALACYYGYPSVVELLLEAGADPSPSGLSTAGIKGTLGIPFGSHGPTCKHIRLDVVKVLCSFRGSADEDEIEAAQTQGYYPTIAQWLADTADCATPLHYPSTVPPERARRLLRAGADLHAAREPGGRTPLSLARELDDNADAPKGSTAWLVLRAAELGTEVVSGAWSRHNHVFWPAASRARARELVWLWKRTVGEGKTEKTLPLGVWVEHVMKHAVE